VLTVAPGLYEVSYGFFVRDEPTVQCLVNGEVVLNGESTSSQKVFGRHSAGNVVGFTVMEILSLPERARVSIQYQGEDEVEGFLSLRKL
jgi:hypothetical protein